MNEVYAAKVINKKGLLDKELKEIRSEIKMHKSLKHPHILKILNDFEDHNHIYIIFERCSQSNFMDLLKQKKVLPIEDVRK